MCQDSIQEKIGFMLTSQKRKKKGISSCLWHLHLHNTENLPAVQEQGTHILDGFEATDKDISMPQLALTLQ